MPLLHPMRLRQGTEISGRIGLQSSCVWSAISFAKWAGLHFKVSDTSISCIFGSIGRLAHASQPPVTHKCVHMMLTTRSIMPHLSFLEFQKQIDRYCS